MSSKLDKTLKALTSSAIVAASLATVPAVFAEEVSFDASVSASNMYLWRGYDLGMGDAAISGDLTASYSNSYATVWASSGDASAGTEYDLIVGYGREMGEFNFDVNLTNYIYPSHPDGELDTFGELTEVILSLGYGPVSFSHANNVAGGSGYSYTTLGGELGDFSILLGNHDFDVDDDEAMVIIDEEAALDIKSLTHLDLSYAYNENLSFTVSKVIAQDDGVDDNTVSEDTLFVISLSLPIEIK